MALPDDAFILLSFINTKLRDDYSSLDELCSDMNVEKEFIVSKLGEVGFEYNKELNKFF